ncbi:MAG TPA: hypothetical protein VFI82_02665 [Terriglobales bacterium]|nr:hypothetical protein [Terriglobales bacterium]
MRYRISGAALLIFACIAVPLAAPAQQSQDDRIKALEERIIALEGQVRTLKAQQAQAATAATPATAVPAPAAPVGAAAETPAQVAGTQPAATLPVYGGASAAAKALNPDISVIGDFIGSMGHNPLLQTPAFQMHESEVGFQAIVDPYARGDFFISFGEQGVNLEEGYITFTALPAGFVLRGGKMRAAFGKVNTLHNHVLPWIDRPLVTNSLAGGEDGINDAGLSLTRILPAPKGLFLEATGQVLRGDSADVFTSSKRSDVSAVAHLRGYRDISESTNIDIGASYARGHNDLGSSFLTQLYGVDATLRWKPLRRSIYHSFVGRSEFIWSRREQMPRLQRSFGWYAAGDYQFGRRWFGGARYDRSDRSHNDGLTDSGTSLVLTYWPSEFSQIRGQYRLTRYAEHLDAHEFLMQLQFSLGAHGAHPF